MATPKTSYNKSWWEKNKWIAIILITDVILLIIGIAVVLAIIGFLRELLGSGQIFGRTILSDQWYTSNQMMILAPGAFFALGIVIGIFNAVKGPEPEEKK